MVVKICPPKLPTNPDLPPEFIEIEAIYSKKITQIAWRDLQDETMWKQGWLWNCYPLKISKRKTCQANKTSIQKN